MWNLIYIIVQIIVLFLNCSNPLHEEEITKRKNSDKSTNLGPCFGCGKEVNKKDFYNLIKINFTGETIRLEKLNSQKGSLMGYDEKAERQKPDFYERFVWMNIKNY